MISAIHILNASILKSEHLGRLATKVGDVFGVRTDVLPSTLEIGRTFDQSRRQHNSTALLTLLLGHPHGQTSKSILVVDVDLFIPVLTFVFGEAQLNGIAAVVSTHRLHNEFYGLPLDDTLMQLRLQKEIIHELGHTFGLYHCRQFDCVMHSSTYVEEIDLKHSELCKSCSEVLRLSV